MYLKKFVFNTYPWYSYRYQIYGLVIGKDISYVPMTVLERLYNLKTITVAEGNLAYTSSDNVLFDKEMYMLVYYPGALDAENYVIPSTVTEIGEGAFADASLLTSLTIPASVISIPDYSMPAYGNLASVTVASGNPAYCSVDGVLYDKNQSLLMLYPPQKTDTSFAIPDTVTQLWNNAFPANEYLTAVTVPAATVDSLGVLTLTGTGVLEDPENALAPYADAVRIINISDGITDIADRISLECRNTESITVPASVTAMGSDSIYPFHDLVIHAPNGSIAKPYASLRSIDFVCSDGETAETVFRTGSYADDITWTLYDTGRMVFSGTGEIAEPEDYDSVPWYTLSEYVIPEGVTTLGSSIFFGPRLQTITIPASVTEIESYFNLNQMSRFIVSEYNTVYTISEGITTIGERAIFGNDNLTTLTIPASVTKIGAHAVYNCSNLSSAIIYAMDTEIPDYAVYYNASGFVITAHDGSDAEFYAKDHNISFQVFEGEEDLPNDVAAGKIGTDITWALADTGVLTISGTGAIPDYSGSSSNPWYYDYRSNVKSVVIGEGITVIGKYTFSSLSNIFSFTLPSTLETIADYAFADCDALTSIDIPASVTSIGVYAFNSCDRLAAININEGNTAYASVDGVLFNKDVTTLVKYPSQKTGTAYTAPETVTTIGTYAFYYANTLTSITFPEALEALEYRMVYYCSGLTDLIFHSTDAVFDSSAIYGYSNRITITAHNASTAEYYAKEKGIAFQVFDGEADEVDVLYSGFCNADGTVKWELYDDGLLRISGTGAMDGYSTSSVPWKNYRSQVKSIEVADGVTNIGAYAFYYCTACTSVSIADSVTSIGIYAFDYNCQLESITLPANLETIMVFSFMDCSKIKSLTIPASVTSIGDRAFNGMSALNEIIVEDGNTVYSSEYGVLFNADKTTLILYPSRKTDTSYIIPSTVTTIKQDAFYYVTSLTSLTLPAALKTVEDYAVYGSYLKTFTIHSMDAEFVTNSFYLSSPSSVTVTVHDGSTAEVYAKEKGFTIQYFDGETDTNSTIAEGTCGDSLTWMLDENGLLLISGEGDMTNFTNYAMPWYDYADKIQTVVVEEGVTSIGNNAFYNFGTNLTSVTIADSVTSIGNYAFRYCYTMTELKLPANLVSIGNYAFYCTYGLAEIDFPETLETIGTQAFYNCSNLKFLHIPAAVTSIGNKVFYNCTSLESIAVDADNTVYSSEDGVLYDKDKTILYLYPSRSDMTGLDIPDTDGRRHQVHARSGRRFRAERYVRTLLHHFRYRIRTRRIPLRYV